MKLEDMSKHELIDLIKSFHSKSKYGLVWETEKTSEHFEFDNNKILPIVSELKKFRIADSTTSHTNYLIEGDNFYALNILRYTHQGQVDFIYIDPPYNTGNRDFKYNDSFVEKEDTFRHSKWLSFMSKRLVIAKELMSENGVIFVSIGDDEQANLKLLMDSIFGEANFVATVPRLAKTSSDKGTFYAPSKDYVLVYKHSKRTEKFNDVLDDDYKSRFKNKDERGHYATVGLFQAALDSRPNQRYWIECPDGSFIIPPGNVFPKKIKDGEPVTPLNNEDKVWRWSYESYLKQKHLLVFKKSNRSPMLNEKKQKSNWNVDTKYYLEDRQESGKRPRDWMDNHLNTMGSNEMNKYELSFSYPKPSSLIKYLIQISHRSNEITVLDFFAGSGTTGDAVLQLNKEDGGKRKFILVTNNEEKICEEITYARLKKTIRGFKNSSGQKIEGLGGNLNYLQIKFIKKSLNSDDMKMRIMDNCVDLLCFREGIFDEVETSDENFKIFRRDSQVLGIYNAIDQSNLKNFKKALEKLDGNKKVYIFTFDNEGLNPNDFIGWKDIEIEPIPKKILEVIGELNAY
jgi:adenine-specific DNA-methyltransferase